MRRARPRKPAVVMTPPPLCRRRSSAAGTPCGCSGGSFGAAAAGCNRQHPVRPGPARHSTRALGLAVNGTRVPVAAARRGVGHHAGDRAPRAPQRYALPPPVHVWPGSGLTPVRAPAAGDIFLVDGREVNTHDGHSWVDRRQSKLRDGEGYAVYVVYHLTPDYSLQVCWRGCWRRVVHCLCAARDSASCFFLRCSAACGT